MARHKLPEDKKKPKISITIDKVLNELMEEQLQKTNINTSKYIENLIRKDFESKGYDVSPDVQK